MIVAAFVASAAFASAIFVAVCRHQCLLRDRARLMRDAIRHRDFSFRLPTRGLLFGERALQEALNDMGVEIQKLVAQSEVESWQKLTRVLTHEIINVTTPIQCISQAYLSRPDIKGTPYEEGIRAIHNSSSGLAAFVESYRKLTQLQEPVLQDICLYACLGSISSLYPHLHWVIDVSPDIVVRADECLFRQAVINMVKNAIEAEARSIGIRHVASQDRGAQRSSTFHRLLISNDGHVIPDDVAREIFVPFFTTRPQGSGIGLSLARQILMMQRLSLSLRERPVCGYNVTFEIEDVRL